MTVIEQCLALIKQATQLQQDIVRTLSEGDRETAESLCLQHQQIVESIPFNELKEPLPENLVLAFKDLQTGTDKLTKLTTDIQQEIGHQLSGVARGKAGSHIYLDIDKNR